MVKEKLIRLSIDVPAEEHIKIKMAATLKGQTIREFIRDCVSEKLDSFNFSLGNLDSKVTINAESLDSLVVENSSH